MIVIQRRRGSEHSAPGQLNAALNPKRGRAYASEQRPSDSWQSLRHERVRILRRAQAGTTLRGFPAAWRSPEVLDPCLPR